MKRLLSTEGVPQWNVWVRPSPLGSRFTTALVCPLNPKPLGGNLIAWAATL